MYQSTSSLDNVIGEEVATDKIRCETLESNHHLKLHPRLHEHNYVIPRGHRTRQG